MGYVEQIKLANDQAFLDQVRVAMMTAAVAIQGEAVAPNTNGVFQKRQQLSTKVLNDPDNYVGRFSLAVIANATIVRGAPIQIASSTAANPSVVTTSAAHGLATGDVVMISNHAGNLNANGPWTVTLGTTTTFTIPLLGTAAGTLGTVMKMPTDAAIQNQVNAIFNDIAGVTIND